jgi:hypothetical protein
MSQAKSVNTTSPSRRALLPAVAAAALATGTVANAVAIGMAKAGEVDPIFAAIDLHREAIIVHQKAGERFHALAANDEPVPWFETNEERTAWVSAEVKRRKGSPRNIAYDHWNEATGSVTETTDRLIETVPTTLAGAVAALEYWAEFMEFTVNNPEGDYDFLDADIHSAFVRNIAEAIGLIERELIGSTGRAV